MREQIEKFASKIFNVDSEYVTCSEVYIEGMECLYSLNKDNTTLTLLIRSQEDINGIYTYNEYTYSPAFVLDLVECFERCNK